MNGDVTMIPGVETVHPRSAWCPPDVPISGPPALWAEITSGVIHYPGEDEVPDGDIGEFEHHIPRWLAATHRSYVRHRGYSLGYWWAVDWLGGAWQIRGWEFRSAANPGRRHNPNNVSWKNANRWTVPILLIMDVDKRATAEQAHTVRMILREADRHAGVRGGFLDNRPRPHSYWDPTACPGRAHEDIQDGLFDLDHPETPITEDDDMRDLVFTWRHPKYHNVWLVGPGGALHLSPELAKAYDAAGVRRITEPHAQTLASCIATSGVSFDDLVKV